jgi:hypothetical protein
MDATISATRSDDTSRLKGQISHYAAFNLRSPIMPPIYDGTGSRTHLGSNHPVLARFVCPVRELKEFSKDADKCVFHLFSPTQVSLTPYRAQKKLQSGKIKMTASALPAFLWAGDPPGEDYDDDNMFEGMFEGYLLERVSVMFLLLLYADVPSDYAPYLHKSLECVWGGDAGDTYL